jgi:hypothetical protein
VKVVLVLVLVAGAFMIFSAYQRGGMAALKPVNAFTDDYWNGPKSQPENRW